jgi:tetratricopeptide (TPR) repeat protein
MALKIEKQLPEADLKDAHSIISKARENGLYISTEAVVAWYAGYPEKALYLAAAASALKNNDNALNNLGAMLNLYGYEEKAVPVLQYLSQKYPQDPDVLNNLGRAYLGMGATDKAKAIFIHCISIAPSHPEANASLGCLYEAQGDKEMAVEHFEKSIEGAMSEIAVERLQGTYSQNNFVRQMKKHYEVPECFNQFKFKIPVALTNIDDYHKVWEIHKAFQESIGKLQGKYDVLIRFAEKKAEEAQKENYANIIKALETSDMGLMGPQSVSPFVRTAARMKVQLAFYMEEVSHRFKDQYRQSIRELRSKHKASNQKISDEFKAKEVWGEMGECGYCCFNCDELAKQKCVALEKNSIRYQIDAAGVYAEFSDKYRLLLTSLFDDAVYWNALLGLPRYLDEVQFYSLVSDFLREIAYISKEAPYLVGPGHYCNDDSAPDYTASVEDFDTIDKPDCPLNLKIPFIVGKLSLDCSSFSIAGGEGIKMGYKKSFKTGQSTLSIGAGISLETPGALASASVNADGGFYVTLDRDGNFTDVGVKFDAGAGIQSKGINTKSGLGYTLGMNSGWGFTATSGGQVLKL